MSQQSNPATLREALTAIIADLRRREKRNLNSAHASLRGFAEAAGYAADQLEKVAALAASGTEAAPVTCESCKSTNTQRYENAGGLKMYSCTDCGWHHFVPAQDAAIPQGETKLTRLLDRLDERIAEHDQPQIPSNIRDWLEIEIAAMLRQPASPEGEGREADDVHALFEKWWDFADATLAVDLKGMARDSFCAGWVCGEAARQSAAPSGGAAATTCKHGVWIGNNCWQCDHDMPAQPIELPVRELAQEILKPHWPIVRNMDESESRNKEVDRIVSVIQRAVAMQTPAQQPLQAESKTGAVTETK